VNRQGGSYGGAQGLDRIIAGMSACTGFARTRTFLLISRLSDLTFGDAYSRVQCDRSVWRQIAVLFAGCGRRLLQYLNLHSAGQFRRRCATAVTLISGSFADYCRLCIPVSAGQFLLIVVFAGGVTLLFRLVADSKLENERWEKTRITWHFVFAITRWLSQLSPPDMLPRTVSR